MLDLIKFMDKLDLRNEDGQQTILCAIRKKRLVLQPEEIVRQLFIQYLIHDLQYPTAKIAVEKGIMVNGLKRRFDILMYNSVFEPYILVECKSMFVEITQDVLEQVSHYNVPLAVKYLVVTNGKFNYFFELNADKTKYERVESLPKKKK